MKFEQQNVWTDANGDALLRQTNPEEWQVIPSTVSAARLEELGEAIRDALRRCDAPKAGEKEGA